MPASKNNSPKTQSIRKLDIIIILILLFLSCFSFFLIPHSGNSVTIIDDGQVIYSGSLSIDMTITTQSGNNTIIIKDGEAYMHRAFCPDQTCVHMGRATPAHPVVCLPNKVMIIIDDDNELDGVTY